jgi:hypothetical protein
MLPLAKKGMRNQTPKYTIQTYGVQKYQKICNGKLDSLISNTNVFHDEE